MKILYNTFLAITMAASTVGADSFDEIKADLAGASCVEFEFISILESAVFDEVDSSFGNAVLASDDRYRIAINNDLYLFDLEHVYSYSADNNQVVIEIPQSDNPIGEEIGYIKHLDDFFTSKVIQADREYHLTKKRHGYSGIPDSLSVFIDSANSRLEQIIYYDLNDDLSRIVIINQVTSKTCDTGIFKASFPDSVDTVEL